MTSSAKISAAASMVAMCSSSLEPKWANRPLLLMPRSLARRCRETASRPSAEPTLAAWSRIACLVRIPRCRRRSVVASSAMLCRNISTTGRILLTLHDRSCYFFVRWNLIQIESANAHRPGLVALEPSDGAPVARLFGRLSNESIYRRFFSPISRPEQFVAAILRVDRRDPVAVPPVENGEIVGVAQFARTQGKCEAG